MKLVEIRPIDSQKLSEPALSEATEVLWSIFFREKVNVLTHSCVFNGKVVVTANLDKDSFFDLCREILSGRILGQIRDSVTCRFLDFGFDGQSYLCIKHADELTDLGKYVSIHEMDRLLIESDHFDGIS